MARCAAPDVGHRINEIDENESQWEKYDESKPGEE
jgi:hypothetical protein